MSRTIAIFPWGDVIEDYLAPMGLTATDFAEQMTGGWLFGYIAALQSAGWSPIVVAPSSAVHEATRLEHAATGAPIWLVPGRSSQSIHNANLRALHQWKREPAAAFRQVIKRENCRALLIQEYEHPRFDVLVRLAARAMIPAFATFQGGDHTLSRVEKLVRGGSIATCAGLIIASAAERRRVEATYKLPSAKISPAPNSLDTDEWTASPRDEARRSLGLPDDQFIAITHGRIDIHRKGLDVLLAAWSGPGQLVLIGSGQDRARFQAMVANRPDIRWIDHYTNDRGLVRQWLSAADIYVTASRIEGMPVAPLEAMACGLPIVASRAHGLTDIFGDGERSGGLLVSVNDPFSLRDAILRLEHDPDLRRRLGRAARQHVERDFSIKVVGQALNAFLSERSRCAGKAQA